MHKLNITPLSISSISQKTRLVNIIPCLRMYVNPIQSNPIQAKPSQAKPSQAKPSQAKPKPDTTRQDNRSQASRSGKDKAGKDKVTQLVSHGETSQGPTPRCWPATSRHGSPGEPRAETSHHLYICAAVMLHR
jgi:hypothetical protein